MAPKRRDPQIGLQRLIDKYKREFKKPENTRYYSEKDFVVAQKRYIHYRLNTG